MKIDRLKFFAALAVSVALWSVATAARVTITGKRFQNFTEPESMGVVTDTTYVRCFWPVSAEPLEIFAPGSSGIIVEGPPTPRNILFPDDTVFVNGTRPDCFFEGKDDPGHPGKKLDPAIPENRVEITKAKAKTIKKEKKEKVSVKAKSK